MFAGFLSGLLGVGGGIFLTPVLIFVFHHNGLFHTHESQAAVGSSLAVIMFTAFSTMLAYQHRKNIDWKFIKHLLPGLILGPFLGSAIGTSISSNFLSQLLGLFVILLAIQIFIPQEKFPKINLRQSHLLGIGAAAGTLSGLVGLGGGVLLIPLINSLGIPLRRAAGLGITAGLFVAISGVASLTLIGYLRTPPTYYIYWPGVLKIATTSVVFAWIGASVNHILPMNILKICFAVFLVIVGCSLLFFR